MNERAGGCRTRLKTIPTFRAVPVFLRVDPPSLAGREFVLARFGYSRVMLRVTVLQRGKLKDDLVVSLRDEYVKRFRKYGELRIVERPEKDDVSIFPDTRGVRVVLDETGKALPSVEFARTLERWMMSHGAVHFAVGGAYGHTESTLAAATSKLSLGPMTLNHALAHLVLVEQVYRAATILRGDPYHHA